MKKGDRVVCIASGDWFGDKLPEMCPTQPKKGDEFVIEFCDDQWLAFEEIQDLDICGNREVYDSANFRKLEDYRFRNHETALLTEKILWRESRPEVEEITPSLI